MSTKKYRTKTVRVAKSGAYVQVWQHPGDAPLIEANFFDGQGRSIADMVARQRALTKAIRIAKAWNAKEQVCLEGGRCRFSPDEERFLGSGIKTVSCEKCGMLPGQGEALS